MDEQPAPPLVDVEQVKRELYDELYPTEPTVPELWSYAQGTSVRAKRLEARLDIAERALGSVSVIALAAIVGLFLLDRRLRKVERI